MWAWTRRAGWRLWGAIAALAVCLGLLVDLPEAKSQLEEAVSAVIPIGAALIPYAALFGAIFVGGTLLTATVKWLWDIYLDIRLDRPMRRAFQECYPQIQRCRELNSEEGRTIERHVIWVSELKELSGRLHPFGIKTPSLPGKVKIGDAQRRWSIYLARLTVLANHGNLEAARQMNPSESDQD